jgi:lipid-A-disaccharide synthase
MNLFFSVGEPSGDLHGANLISDLQRRRRVRCCGFGGPKMAAVGCDLHADLTELAVMFFSRVLLQLHRFWSLVKQAERHFDTDRPDAVILIDYPGFNWWIARAAKKRGIPVFYYGPPQMWAWASWRIRKMRRLVDHVLCKLPFEARWYAERGCKAIYVGHPYFDAVRRRPLDRAFVERERTKAGRLVTILPGSRNQEVINNIECFLNAASLVAQKATDVRFAVAAYNEKQATMMRAAIEERISADASFPSIDVFEDRTPELIELAHSCIACSGSVSLELLHYAKPTVIYYRASRLIHALAPRLLMRVKYITLVNLLADHEPFASRPKLYDPAAPGAENVPFPEYPSWKEESERLAPHIVEWLGDDREHQRRIAQLVDLRERYGSPGASDRAADYILEALGAGRVVPAPHLDRT